MPAKLFLFGDARLEVDGQVVVFETRKALAMLAFLAMTNGHASRNTLMAMFWPDADETRGRSALRRTLSALRAGIGADALDTGNDAVTLLPKAIAYLDVSEFRRLADTSTHSHPSGEVCDLCLQDLAKASDIYTAQFMAGFGLRDSPAFDDWQFFESESLSAELGSVFQRLVQGLSERGKFEPALQIARRWLALDTLREEVHTWLMKLYAWDGQRNAALRQYRECMRILDEELGVKPLAETNQVYQAILDHQLPAPVSNRNTLVEIQPAQVLPPVVEKPSSWPLVGRTAEFSRLVDSYTTKAGKGYLLAIEGEAGIGKTRLATEFLDWLRKQNRIVLNASCFEGESSLPFSPFMDLLRAILADRSLTEKLTNVPPGWLAEAARLIPEMGGEFSDLPIPTTMDNPGAQARFFEGLRQVLMAVLVDAQLPGVLFVDDLHWADTASLDLLTYIVRRSADQPCLILLTWRSTDVPGEHRLRGLILETSRSERAAVVNLARLSPEAVAVLASQAIQAGVRLPDGGAARLYDESEGLPFIAVEYLRMMTGEADTVIGQPWNLPEKVRGLLRSRINAASETAQQLLTAAAVLGHQIGLEPLRLTSGRSELESLQGLEELIRRGLLHETYTGDELHRLPVYDFQHDKLRETVYAEISLVRRKLLHHRAADALVKTSRGGGATRELAAQLAFHYAAAGMEELAAGYAFQAGEQARMVYANAIALKHFQSALAYGYPDRAQVQENIAALHMLSGDYASALTSFEDALRHTSHPVDRMRQQMRIGVLHQRKGDWQASQHQLEAALAIASADDHRNRAILLAALSLSTYKMGDPVAAKRLASQALESANLSGDALARSRAYNILGMLTRQNQGFTQALAYLEQSYQAATDAQDPTAQIASLNNLAGVLAEAGEFGAAQTYIQQALEICQRLGDRHQEAALLSNLADTLHAAGADKQALAIQKQAVAIFADIGTDDGGKPAHPEIWMLTEW